MREVGWDTSGFNDSAKANPRVFAFASGRFRAGIIFVDQQVRTAAARLLAEGELDRSVARFRNSEWAWSGVCDELD